MAKYDDLSVGRFLICSERASCNNSGQSSTFLKIFTQLPFCPGYQFLIMLACIIIPLQVLHALLMVFPGTNPGHIRIYYE